MGGTHSQGSVIVTEQRCHFAPYSYAAVRMDQGLWGCTVYGESCIYLIGPSGEGVGDDYDNSVRWV